MSEKIEHEGVISRIVKENAWVSIIQRSACAECHAKSMCNISEQKEKIIEIQGIDSSFHEGEKVIVTGNASLGLLAVLYAFVIPIISIVLILFFFLTYFHSESIAALAAIVNLIIHYSLLYIFRDKLKRKFVFTIKKIDK